jgi:hypothetical protein
VIFKKNYNRHPAGDTSDNFSFPKSFSNLKHFFGLLDVAFLVAAVSQVDEGGRVVAVGDPGVLGALFRLGPML